jgi:hypothetical protein
MLKLRFGKRSTDKKMADRILNHLCDYALQLSYRDLPEEVIRRTKHMSWIPWGARSAGPKVLQPRSLEPLRPK